MGQRQNGSPASTTLRLLLPICPSLSRSRAASGPLSLPLPLSPSLPLSLSPSLPPSFSLSLTLSLSQHSGTTIGCRLDQARAANCFDAEREGILQQAELNRLHRRHRPATTTHTYLRPRVPADDEMLHGADKKNLEAQSKAEERNGAKARRMETGAGLG